MVEGMIREYVGQSRLALPSSEFTDYISGDNTTLLRLRNSPVIAVSSVVVSSTAITSANLYTGAYYIQLLEGTFTKGVRNVVVTYTAGGGTVTPDVRMAAAMMIVAVNNYYGRGGSDASLKWSTMMDDGRDHQRGGEDSPVKRMGLAAHLRGIMSTVINQKRFRIA
jgi:hypothetical protein